MITNISIEDVLLDSAKEVFETMAFMDIEKVQEQGLAIAGNALLSSVTFDGKLEGCLGMCCTELCARDIASNMLGVEPDEELTSDQVHDAAGEMINMIMGKIELHLQRDYGLLQASIPCVTTGIELRNNLGNNAQRYSINLNLEDAHVISLSLICRKK